jgi:hypothetical protein
MEYTEGGMMGSYQSMCVRTYLRSVTSVKYDTVELKDFSRQGIRDGRS